MAFGFDTAGNIIADAAVELGLVSRTATLTAWDPFGNTTDANQGLLCQLCKSLAHDLQQEYSWTALQNSYTFTTAAGQAQYQLPADFLCMIDQTGWNRSTRLPLAGPMAPQEWQYLKARLVGVTFNFIFRQMQQRWWAFPDTNTPAGYNIGFEYKSRFTAQSTTIQGNMTGWVGPWNNGTTYSPGAVVTNGGQIYSTAAGGTSGTNGPTFTTGSGSDGVVTWTFVSAAGAEWASASTDLILFDRQLFARGLKLAWKKEKGFDTGAAQADFDATLEAMRGNDAGARILNLTNGIYREPLVNNGNLPYTGWGQ